MNLAPDEPKSIALSLAEPVVDTGIITSPPPENFNPVSPRTDYILRNVASIQRKLFTIRIFSAASLVGASSAFLGIIASMLEPTQISFTAAAAGVSVYIVMNGLYRYMAPKPESIFT